MDDGMLFGSCGFVVAVADVALTMPVIKCRVKVHCYVCCRIIFH